MLAHGIPDDRPLKEGDIVNIDFAAYVSLRRPSSILRIQTKSQKDGLHSDMSETFAVGDIDERTRKLVETARGALYESISVLRPGEKLSVIGNTIE